MGYQLKFKNEMCGSFKEISQLFSKYYYSRRPRDVSLSLAGNVPKTNLKIKISIIRFFTNVFLVFLRASHNQKNSFLLPKRVGKWQTFFLKSNFWAHFFRPKLEKVRLVAKIAVSYLGNRLGFLIL